MVRHSQQACVGMFRAPGPLPLPTRGLPFQRERNFLSLTLQITPPPEGGQEPEHQLGRQQSEGEGIVEKSAGGCVAVPRPRDLTAS